MRLRYSLLSTLVLISGFAFGTCHVVSSAGTGTKSGADWANTAQWGVTSGFTNTTLVSGDSYYFMDEPDIRVTLTGVSVINGTNRTLTRASGSFIVDGLVAGYYIKLNGFTNFNNISHWHYITNVTATVLTLADIGTQFMASPYSILVTETSASGAVSYVARNPANDYRGISTSKTNVTYKKAISSDHCTDTGPWVLATMGSGSAYFSAFNLVDRSNGPGYTNMIVIADGSLWTGQSNTDDLHGYGFVIDCAQNVGFVISCVATGSGTTFTYSEVFAQGAPSNNFQAANLNGGTVVGNATFYTGTSTFSVTSGILTFTGLTPGGGYSPNVAPITGQWMRFTTQMGGAAGFLGGHSVAVCDPGVNAGCVSPSTTQFSALLNSVEPTFSHADVAAVGVTCTLGTVCAEVNISERTIGITTRVGTTVSHNYLHDTSDNSMNWGANSNQNVVQNNVIARVYSSNSVHGGGIAGNQSGIVATSYDTSILYNKFFDIAGTAFIDTLSTGSGMTVVTVTNTAVASNVLTVNFTGTASVYPVGQPLYFTNLPTSTFLNGQTVRVSTSAAGTFTAAFTHADYGTTAEGGASRILITNDNIKIIGNYFANTPNGHGLGVGNYTFYCGPQGAVPNSACNVTLSNNTFDKVGQVGTTFRAENYGAYTWQNNLIVDTTGGTSLTTASANLIRTDDHNTFLCLTGSTCYSANNLVKSFDCVADECLPNSGTGNQSNPFTAGSYPTNVLKVDLVAATTSGAAIAYTDPNGIAAPQGGIYNRGAFEFAAVASSYLVSLNVSGTWTGTIVGSGGSPASVVNCTVTAGVASGTCSETQNAGATPTYTPTVSVGALTGWSGGGCAGTGTCVPTVNSPLTLTMAGNAAVSCSLTFASNSLNAPSLASATTTMSGLSGPGSFWFIFGPSPDNLPIYECSYPFSGCNANGQTGNIIPVGSGLYTGGACSNGVCCTGSTAPLNINTGAGSAAH